MSVFVRGVNCEFNPFRCVPPPKECRLNGEMSNGAKGATSVRFTLIPHTLGFCH